MLSFLIYGTPTATVKGLNAFPKTDWPTNIPLLYYSYHIMAGLGTIFVAVMAASAFLLWRGQALPTRAGCCGSLLLLPAASRTLPTRPDG